MVLGTTLCALNDNTLVQFIYARALSLNAGDPDAMYHLGFVYLQQSKTEDAAALFVQVVSAHPDYANAQYELGKILLDRGQNDDAIAHLEAAARLRPET